MKARDLGELAIRNLREALLRNSLTTLGIAVGVASLVAMLSLGVGLQELASKRLSNSGLFDTVIVMSNLGQRGFGRPTEPPKRAGAGSGEGRRSVSRRRWMTTRGRRCKSSPTWLRCIRKSGFRPRCASRESLMRRWSREFQNRRVGTALSTESTDTFSPVGIPRKPFCRSNSRKNCRTSPRA